MTIALLGAGSAAGCQDLAAACDARFQHKDYEQALAICTRAFHERKAPGAAVNAAGAAYHLKRADELHAWVERTRGHAREAGVLCYLGRMQGDAGDAAAPDTHRRALAIAHERHDAQGVARNAYMLHVHAWRQGAYATALSHAYESFAAGRRAGDLAEQSAAMEAIAMNLFGLGDLEGTRRALAHLRPIADPANQALQSRILQREGLVHEAEQRPALARDAYARALVLAEAAGATRLQRDNLLNLASVSIDLDDRAAARDHLAALRALDPAYDARATLLYRARLARREGRLDDAAGDLAQARARIDIPDWLWEIELEAGYVAELGGDVDAAAAAYERSIAIVEDMRGNLESNELKAWTLARRRHPYEALFRLHARQGQARDALAALERARARSLLDAFIARTEAGPGDGQGPDVRPIAAPEAGDGAGRAADPDSAGRAADPDAAGSTPPPWIRSAVERSSALSSLLPAMSTSPVARLRPVDELVHSLGPRTAFLYFRIQDGLWLLRVQDGRIEPVELASGEAALHALDELVDTLVRAPGDARAAAALGRRLLPAALLPAPGTPLYLVPDGPTMRLPFAVLRVEDQARADGATAERHLIERHPLVHLPSLSALAAIEDRARPPDAPPAALGDPRGDLPEAARELGHVAARLGATPRIGAAATTEALRGTAGARVLHLATHVEVGPRGAALILADGPVDAAQVVTWRLGPALAVLAGCASAVQLTHRHGREMWGSLAAAFLASGTRQVVAALWSIPDRATRAFIERFYAEDGVRDPAGALARVQRAWIADGRTPEEWAPFVLLGTAEPVPGGDRTNSRRDRTPSVAME